MESKALRNNFCGIASWFRSKTALNLQKLTPILTFKEQRGRQRVKNLRKLFLAEKTKEKSFLSHIGRNKLFCLSTRGSICKRFYFLFACVRRWSHLRSFPFRSNDASIRSCLPSCSVVNLFSWTKTVLCKSCSKNDVLILDGTWHVGAFRRSGNVTWVCEL